jgi:medium-chain acyl-[acyl-carrier-protein] hydrolase
MSIGHAHNRTARTRADEPRMRLFCLPFAGGAARVFADWQDRLPPWIEVVALELPGHGTRFRDRPHTSLDPLLEDLLSTVQPLVDRPYAVFGHSLGGMLGYELACDLQRHGTPPVYFFPSACRAPHLPARTRAHGWSDSSLREHIAELGGTPPEVIENDQLMELLFPVLRADLRIADTYLPRTGAALTCPTLAFCGSSDQETPECDIAEWQQYVQAPFRVRALPGGHFFLDSESSTVLSLIASAVDSALEGAPRTSALAGQPPGSGLAGHPPTRKTST